MAYSDSDKTPRFWPQSFVIMTKTFVIFWVKRLGLIAGSFFEGGARAHKFAISGKTGFFVMSNWDFYLFHCNKKIYTHIFLI